MQVVHWKTEISAAWKRALDLKELLMTDGGLRLEVEDESGRSWSLDFRSVQAWKVTSEECAGGLIAKLPTEGSLFLVQESGWLKELGDVESARQSEHFLICCCDEVVEVLAWNCSIRSIDK